VQRAIKNPFDVYNSATQTAVMPKRRKTSVERQIRQQQASTDPVVPWTAFCRVANEVLNDVTDESTSYNIRSEAVRALQCASEDMIVNLFQDADRLAAYTGRETVSESDLKFVRHQASMMPGFDAKSESQSEEMVEVET
tara:strand:+ start:7064 stop:7480 length:417 start_codon:yes stop_codon:yes gene_type:complete